MNICSICSHDAASAIDATLEAGRSIRSVADTFGVGYESLKRHRKNHLSVAPVSQMAAVAGESEAEYLARLVADLKDMDTTRFTPGQRIAHLDAVRRAVGDLAKVSPPARPQSVSFDEVDGLAELIMAIFDALEPFPEARKSLTPVYEAFIAKDPEAVKSIAWDGARRQVAS